MSWMSWMSWVSCWSSELDELDELNESYELSELDESYELSELDDDSLGGVLALRYLQNFLLALSSTWRSWTPPQTDPSLSAAPPSLPPPPRAPNWGDGVVSVVWSPLSSLLREDSDLMFNIISDKIAVEITTVFSQVISVFTPNLQSNNNVVLESAS